MSDSALERHRLERRLRRAGAGAVAAVDPWACEAELARGAWDAVLWGVPRLERLARSVLAGADGPAAVLVLEPGARTGRLVDALGAGYADAVRADAPAAEVVARTMAAARTACARRAAGEGARAFRRLADGSRDLLMRVDATGVVLFASAAAREMLGQEPARLVGRRAVDLCHPDEREALAHALDGEAPPGRPVAHRLRGAGGAWTWVETTVGAVRDASGRLVEAHADSRDVTARMRADAERGALTRVTAAVAGGADLADVAALAAREAAVLAGAETAAVVRFHGDEGLVVGAAGPDVRRGDRIPLAVVSPRAAVAPVTVEGSPWGVLLARAHGRPGGPPAAGLAPLADLVALAVVNARGRERLLALATTDPLTGLANRRTYHERLDAECARAGRTGAPLSLVLIDLDHFKRVNDTHGHQVGDEVLREVARRLRAHSRRDDVVARVGGEELAWLLPGADADAAAEAAERLRRDIGGARVGPVGRVTASLGVAELAPAEGPARLVRRADAALYAAKAGGRDACRVDRAPGGPLTAAPSG